MKKFLAKLIPVILVGVFSVVGLFLWYKDYSYFYWGEVEPVVAMSYERYDPDDGEKIAALYNSNFAERSDVIEALAWYSLENHMQLKTTNNGDSSLFLSVYDYQDYTDPVLKESMIEILPGDHWTYDTEGGSYMLVVYGTGVRGGAESEPEGLSFVATNVDYMYACKNAVQYVLLSLIILCFFQMGFAAGSFTRKCLRIFDLAAGAIGTVLTVYFAYRLPRVDYLISSTQCFSVVLACYAFAVSWMDMKSAGDHNAVNMACRDRYRLFAAAVFSIAASFLFFARSMNSRSGSFLNRFSWMNQGNVKAYAVMLILFCVLFLILILWFKNIFKGAAEIAFDRNAAYSAVLIFCACVSRFVFYGNEGKINNAVLWLLIYAALFIGIYISILRGSGKQRDRASFAKRKYFENSLCFMVYGIVALASSLKQTIINCWGKGFSDIFHCHGYFSPISYVVNGNAFLGGWIDKYGHYGLWYKPIMDIFGNTSLVMGIIFGIVNGVTVFIFLYLIHKTTDNLMIRLCCAVALGVSSIAGHMYPMTLTNRLFVVALTLFLIRKSSDGIMKSCSMKKMLWIELIGFIAGIFNFITSTDAGIISNCVWTLAASLLVVYAAGKDKTEEKISGKITTTIKSFLFHFLLFALEILLAYAVIKVWNYNHADIPIHRILEYADEFDFQSEAEGQNNKFIFQNGIWIYILITFMMVFAWEFKKLLAYYTDQKGKLDIKSIFAFSLSVMSFGMFVFYVSRPEDFLCIGDLFIICVCLLAEQAVSLSDRGKRRRNLTLENLAGMVIMTGCVFVFTVGFFNVGNAVNNEYNYIVRYHQLDWQRLTEEFEKFQQDVPESTYVIDNLGLSMIYMNIGREMPDDMENCDYIICCGLPDDIEEETEFIKFVSVDAIEYNLYRIVR